MFSSAIIKEKSTMNEGAKFEYPQELQNNPPKQIRIKPNKINSTYSQNSKRGMNPCPPVAYGVIKIKKS